VQSGYKNKINKASAIWKNLKKKDRVEANKERMKIDYKKASEKRKENERSTKRDKGQDISAQRVGISYTALNQ